MHVKLTSYKRLYDIW